MTPSASSGVFVHVGSFCRGFLRRNMKGLIGSVTLLSCILLLVNASSGTKAKGPKVTDKVSIYRKRLPTLSVSRDAGMTRNTGMTPLNACCRVECGL